MIEAITVEGTQPGENGQEVRTTQHVHRIELEDGHAVQDSTEVLDADGALRLGTGEPLSGKSDTASLCG